MSDVNFTECPMYQTAKEFESVRNNNNALAKEMKKLIKDNRKKDKFLIKHMTDEEVHHNNVEKAILESNEAVTSMGKHIKTLMDDKVVRDLEKDKKEKIRERKEKIRDGVYGTLSVAIVIGAYNFFMDLMQVKNVMMGE